MFASTFSTSTVVIESHYRPKKDQKSTESC